MCVRAGIRACIRVCADICARAHVCVPDTIHGPQKSVRQSLCNCCSPRASIVKLDKDSEAVEASLSAP